jgi:hypothetical protein
MDRKPNRPSFVVGLLLLLFAIVVILLLGLIQLRAGSRRPGWQSSSASVHDKKSPAEAGLVERKPSGGKYGPPGEGLMPNRQSPLQVPPPSADAAPKIGEQAIRTNARHPRRCI